MKVSEASADDYIIFLHRAGYLKMIAPAKVGGFSKVREKARYRFLSHKNTGPKAPMIQRVKHVYDPNLEQVVWPKEDGES